MDYELVLAIVGVSIAVVALGILAVFQQRRLKREEDAKTADLRQTAAGAADAPAGATPFFLAQFRGGSARFFRVYADKAALLFLNAGPFIIMVGPDTPRGTDRRHWALQSLKFLAAGLASGAVASVIALVVIVRVIARNPNQNPGAAQSIVLGALSIIALLAGLFILWVPWTVWRLTRRAAELDALPLKALRELAELDEGSFRAAPDNVASIHFTPLESSTPLEVHAQMKFRHEPTGTWKIETITTEDTRAAIAACRKVFGLAAVTVADELVKELSRARDESAEPRDVPRPVKRR